MLFRFAMNAALLFRAPVVLSSVPTDIKLRHSIPFFTFGFRQPPRRPRYLSEIINLDEPSTSRIRVDDLVHHDLV